MHWIAIVLLVASADAQDALTEQYRVDFRNGKFDNERLRLIGPGAARLVKPGSNGLVVRVPAGAGPNEVGFAPKCVVEGDFEITASYEIQELADPDEGYGVGPAIYIVTTAKAENAATLSRLKRVKEGNVYATHEAWFPESKTGERKREHRVRTFKTGAKSGSLRLVRSGKTLQYLIADGDSPAFRQLHQAKFTDANVELVRVGLHRNGAKTAAAVLWNDFDLRAEKLSGLARPPSRRGWLLWIMLLALVAAALAAGVWYRRRPKAA